MNRILPIVVIALLSLSLAFGAENKSSSAESSGSAVPSMAGKLGLGFIIGAPMGFSVKYYFSKTVALDAAAGYAFSEDTFRLHSDILFHNDKLLSKAFEGFPVALYYGGGAKFVFSDDFMFGVRLPVGVLHDFKKPACDVFFEVVPVVLLTPDIKVDLDAAIGARFYFGLK